MKVSPDTLLTAMIAAFVGQAAAAAVEPTETTAAHPCTTGSPVVSYGYTINYALATPTAEAQARGGYEPDPSWSSAHLLGTQVSFEFPSSCPSIYFPNVFPIAVLSHQRSTNHLSLTLTKKTFGVPQPPVESGIAYAAFKCQYSCNSWAAGSFFLKYAGPGNQNGSYCSCFDDL